MIGLTPKQLKREKGFVMLTADEEQAPMGERDVNDLFICGAKV